MLIGAMLIFVACEPIEKRESLSPAITEGELDSKISVSVDGNNINCSIEDKGIIFWQTSSGKQSNTKTSQFYVPLAGDYTVSCTKFGGDKKVTVTKNVTISQNDPVYYSDEMWELLTNNAEGKTWVWATDGPLQPIWGIGGYRAQLHGGWWGQSFPDLSGQGASENDEITFDLNKAHNFSSVMLGDGPRPGSGSGYFDMELGPEHQVFYGDDASSGIWSYGKITFTNHTIPLGFQPNVEGNPYAYVFDILTLTEDELILALPEPGSVAPWNAAWFYQFKRKGYNY